MIYQTVLDAIGNTPLMRLNRLNEAGCANILVKFEAVNVGGSIKTRSAYQMLAEAERRGELCSNSIVVEPTSGNQGIGLALVCAVKGYAARIIMPDSVSIERRALVKQYGAEVILVHDDGDIGKCIDECINLARSMAAEDERVYLPQQFENIDNMLIHENQTAQEILDDCDVAIHGFCAGFGTGGTISGVGHILKQKFPLLQIWVAEPENAAVLTGGRIGSHLQMGIGDGIIPDNLDQTIYDDICTVTDEEALEMTRLLASQEGLLCGISSGSNVVAAQKLARVLGPDKNVLTILPDTGERYFSTDLFA